MQYTINLEKRALKTGVRRQDKEGPVLAVSQASVVSLALAGQVGAAPSHSPQAREGSVLRGDLHPQTQTRYSSKYQLFNIGAFSYSPLLLDKSLEAASEGSAAWQV